MSDPIAEEFNPLTDRRVRIKLARWHWLLRTKACRIAIIGKARSESVRLGVREGNAVVGHVRVVRFVRSGQRDKWFLEFESEEQRALLAEAQIARLW